MSPGAGAPAPGWHADPFGRHQGRYWDGSAWTEHVDDAGQQSVDPPPPPADTTALDLPAVVFQHQEVRHGDQPATLGVFTGDEEQRQIGWVQYADHNATLTDLAGSPLFQVGTEFGNYASRRPVHLRNGPSAPGQVRSVTVWGPFGEELAQ